MWEHGSGESQGLGWVGGIGVFTASAALLIVWKVNNGSVNPGYRVRIKYSPNLLAKVKLISL